MVSGGLDGQVILWDLLSEEQQVMYVLQDTAKAPITAQLFL